jgi:hypothetical protein
MNSYVEVYHAAAAETKVQITDQKATIHGLRFENNHSAAVYVQLFNAPSSSVTVGTTVATRTYLLPASSVTQIEPRRFLEYFDKGITIACTAGRTNATAPGAASTCTVWFSKN